MSRRDTRPHRSLLFNEFNVYWKNFLIKTKILRITLPILKKFENIDTADLRLIRDFTEYFYLRDFTQWIFFCPSVLTGIIKLFSMKLAENFPTSDTVQSGGAENSLLALCFNFKNYTGRERGRPDNEAVCWSINK